MKNTDNIIHIAYALNDKYAEMACVSMCSILENSADTKIMFHIFSEQISPLHINKLSHLITKYEFACINYHDINIDSDIFVTSEYAGINTPNLTKEAYARVFMPDMLSNIDKLLYIDCDTIIEGDIAGLWSIDISDSLAGMVPDYSFDTNETKKRILGIEDSDEYYNTGVILMNLTGLRGFRLSQIVTDNINMLYKQITEAGQNWYADQEVLNYALCGRIKKLPMRYNSYYWLSLPVSENVDECVETLLRPVIIHFIATPKPTDLGRVPVFVPEWERYYRYKAMTPYANADDTKKTEVFKAREQNTLNALMPYIDKNIIGWYSIWFARQMFEIALHKYELAMTGKRVVIWGATDRTWTLVPFLAANGFVVSDIVDGVESNQGNKIFHYIVHTPDILKNEAGNIFIILCMCDYDVAQKLISTLKSWGYTADDYCHIFAPIREGTGELIMPGSIPSEVL